MYIFAEAATAGATGAVFSRRRRQIHFGRPRLLDLDVKLMWHMKSRRSIHSVVIVE